MVWQAMLGLPGSLFSERNSHSEDFLPPIPIRCLKVALYFRNARQVSLGLGGRLFSEWVAGLGRNTQVVKIQACCHI